MNLKYYMPTKVFMGENCIINNKEILKSLGKKALIVTGVTSAKINGSESDVKKALDFVGISYLVYDKVMSNPTIDCCYEGAQIAKDNKVDFIIAIGGGSPMDAGKAIALLAAQEIPKDKLFSGQYEDKVLPMAYIPTTAGTGSEVTHYSILTNDDAETKTSIATELIFPTITFLDARYMSKLPVKITINTAVDALSHAVEGMLSVKASIISDTLAAKSIRMITRCFPQMLDALNDKKYKFSKKTREQLLYASFMAGIVIAQTGTTVAHAMGYSLTYFKDIDHGRANGLLLGELLKLLESKEPELISRILEAMEFGSTQDFINIMDKLLGEKEVITCDEIYKYSNMAMKTANVKNCIVKLKEEDLIEIYSVTFNK